MPPALLGSQFDALEPLGADERGVVINLSGVQDSQDVIDAFLAESAAITRDGGEGGV
jgi:gluconokinase